MIRLQPVIASVWTIMLACLLTACMASEVPSAPEQTPAAISSPAQPMQTAVPVGSRTPVPPSAVATAPLPVPPTAVPSGPTATPDNAAQAKALANNLADATSDLARYEALLAVMRALAIGVYAPDGQVVVRGAERGPRDFYLYDFELRMMAQSLARHDVWRLDDLAAVLSTMVIRPDDPPLTADATWAIIQDGTREAAGQPTDRLSLGPLLVRELGLRQPESYDILQATAAKDLRFDALQHFLILADFTLPIVQKVWPVAGSSRLAADSGGVFTLKPITLQNACESMVGTAVRESWGIGKFGLGLIRTRLGQYTIGNFAAMALVIVDGIHGSMMAFSIKVRAVAPWTEATHYGHGTPGDPKEFKIIVVMLDQLPDVVVQCGWLLGVEFPKKGGIKDVKMLWFYGDLDQHGEIVCPEVGCKKTDNDGVATLLFKPKQELQPYGFGPVYDADGSVTAVALYQSRLKNYLGSINQIITPKTARSPYWVQYHKQPELDLDFASNLDGTDGAFRGSSVALLESPIHLKFETTLGYYGPGTLRYETKPLPRQHQCDVTWSGSGSSRFVVIDGQITGDPSRGETPQIELHIVPSMEPTKETMTFGCPPPSGPSTLESTFWIVAWSNAHIDYNKASQGFVVTGWKYVQGARFGEIFAEKDWNTSCPSNLCKDQTKLRLSLRPPK